jgi:hypothetical protein
MRCYCPISGRNYFSDNIFKDKWTTLIDPHPIFRVPIETLLPKAAVAVRYGEKRFSEEEQTLIFLALLHSTGAVEWEVPANPSYSLVLKNLDPVLRVATWYYKVSSPSNQLPKMRVSEVNKNLDNIAIWIAAWYEARKEFNLPHSKKLLQDLNENIEYRINKLIHTPGTNTFQLMRNGLAVWALNSAEVKGADKREEWRRILCLQSEEEIYREDLEELEDIFNWMRDHLYHPSSLGGGSGNLFSAKVLEHTDKIVKIKRGGRLGSISDSVGGPAGTFQMLSSASSHEEKSMKVLELEEILSSSHSTLQSQGIPIPTEEPKQSSFGGNKLAFWKAKAAWRIIEPTLASIREIKTMLFRDEEQRREDEEYERDVEEEQEREYLDLRIK